MSSVAPGATARDQGKSRQLLASVEVAKNVRASSTFRDTRGEQAQDTPRAPGQTPGRSLINRINAGRIGKFPEHETAQLRQHRSSGRKMNIA
jgi:hypothetical protein